MSSQLEFSDFLGLGSKSSFTVDRVLFGAPTPQVPSLRSDNNSHGYSFGNFTPSNPTEMKRAVVRVNKPMKSSRPPTPDRPRTTTTTATTATVLQNDTTPSKAREESNQQASTSKPTAPKTSKPESATTTPLPCLTTFASQLQSTLDQMGNGLAPLQQQSQHQVNQITGIAMTILDNALRTTVDTANSIQQTMSPLLQRRSTYTNTSYHRQQQSATTNTKDMSSLFTKKQPSYSLSCDLCYQSIRG